MTIHLEQPAWLPCNGTGTGTGTGIGTGSGIGAGEFQRTNRIDVWQIPLLPSLPQTMDALNQEERQRTESFKDDQSRRSFVSSRLAMYRLFGDYLGLPRDSMQIRADGHAKPVLDAPQTLEFNLSHSGQMILLAVSPERPVGIDVEHQRVVKNWQAIANKVFDQALLGELSHSATPSVEFIGLWTQFEAQQKLFGHGVFGEHAATDTTVEIIHFSPAADYQASLAFPAGSDLPTLTFRQFCW